MLLAARAAGLRHVDPKDPGIARRRAGLGFAYFDAHGERVAAAETLSRIRSLVIPPAWRDVWICASPIGHIQATGRDARGRRQYRYHPQWHEVRDGTKYERTIAFARALPRLRRQVQRDLRRHGLPRDKVIAAIVRLLETTLIRIGNEEYARDNRSYGLSTLRNRHVKVRGSALHLSFRGKAGKEHSVGLRDRRLAQVVRACQELPGQRLFKYVDQDGEPQQVDSDDVNAYLRQAMGDDFSAKDVRTWAGTVLAAKAFGDVAEAASAAPSAAAVVEVVKDVAAHLGNTPAVCRRCYIHPQIIESYLDGGLSLAAGGPASRAVVTNYTSLRPEEKLVLRVLRSRLAKQRRQGPTATRHMQPARAA